jgi:phosphotransferase system  glucose/maltose/N-acetylglucosamine-specific IIC component
MMLEQSYVLLAVAIVVALINFLGAYFAVKKARAKRATRTAKNLKLD